MILNAIVVHCSSTMTKGSVGKVRIETCLVHLDTWAEVGSCVFSSAENSARHPESKIVIRSLQTVPRCIDRFDFFAKFFALLSAVFHNRLSRFANQPVVADSDTDRQAFTGVIFAGIAPSSFHLVPFAVLNAFGSASG